MKIFLMGVVLLLAIPMKSNAMDLDPYIDDTGNYASLIDFQYFHETNLIQYIGGPAGEDLNANAFQFTISQPLTISHLSVDATVLSSGGQTTEHLPLTFQIFSATSTGSGGLGTVPNTNSLVFSSKSKVFSTNGPNDKVYDNKKVHVKTTLQPGTYWLADEITPPVDGGAIVRVQSVDFRGKAVAPEPPTWIFFGLIILLIYFKALSPDNS